MQYYNSNTTLYLNGQFEKAAEATTDLYGQSLHYGYAVFEGIRAYNTHNGTRIFKARAHFERLKKSAELVAMPFPWDIDDLINKTYKVLEINNLKDAYIRPLVYCPANMSLIAGNDASIMICAWDWGAYLGHKLLKVCISEYERPNPKSTPIQAKVSGNYVNSILATTAAKRKGFDEALLLDMNGNIAEAPGANIFIEKKGKLYTPALGNILAGITRATIIELCHVLDIEIIEKQLTVADLKQADSAFFCGTATEIAGISLVDEYHFPLKWTDSAGATLQRTYKNLVLEKQNYEVII
ncbi:branched-chain amino acid transaminase [Pedobacter psychroterrae]|uniref:Branched-chain-amino-acid aminotransferase n=1 Tax=Pedobacter psychroterrae TaxID=2530453 RepID=A0A4R0N9C7_9SPHI|nr:branched-chain amino acid transaminase [Pedobacter psychroterrae]TCC96750.1 branched-chain amino acid transaminase [Pedobacter psychroterrae]